MSQRSPIIELSWTDPYGPVTGEVYEVAQQLWPRLERFAWQQLGDAQTGQQLLMKACALVTRIQSREPERIANLSHYLEVTWKRLVLAEAEKEKVHQTRAQENAVHALEPAAQHLPPVEQNILLQEIVAQMDAWTRTVYEYQVLGHTFEEISPVLGQSAHVIRTKFSKKLKKLRQQLASEK